MMVQNVGMYDGRWLPLQGGPLDCINCKVIVSALEWDSSGEVLYIGGFFNKLGNGTVTPGLVMWTQEDGMQNFRGGGLYLDASGQTYYYNRTTNESVWELPSLDSDESSSPSARAKCSL